MTLRQPKRLAYGEFPLSSLIKCGQIVDRGQLTTEQRRGLNSLVRRKAMVRDYVRLNDRECLIYRVINAAAAKAAAVSGVEQHEDATT